MKFISYLPNYGFLLFPPQFFLSSLVPEENFHGCGAQRFLQAGCSSCHPTNSVTTLIEAQNTDPHPVFIHHHTANRRGTVIGNWSGAHPSGYKGIYSPHTCHAFYLEGTGQIKFIRPGINLDFISMTLNETKPSRLRPKRCRRDEAKILTQWRGKIEAEGKVTRQKLRP